ncbi:MAG TPA: S8 family serine peptidase [Ktedonobacteraceae bacterium]|jgi:subtilisin family serine protease|nr:S8 family serine peptidase [Ktedonobacteraceae bacterium]
MITRQPEWSKPFTADALQKLTPVLPLDNITREWAWEGGTGKGVKVAVIDSGIDASHPAIGAPLSGYVTVIEKPEGMLLDTAPHGDSYGHGTACAGIIRSLAPDCELYSIKVLGEGLSGRSTVFAAGLRWAIENGMHACNLSLGTTKKDFYALLHELTDLAYFRNVVLVTAANNMPVPSFPSVYASVISVAAHEGKDPFVFYYNPHPPVEFGAPGIDVRVAWKNGEWLTTTGNSFAAPHITGIIARILSKHPGLTVFQIKAILRALSSNMTRDGSEHQV